MSFGAGFTCSKCGEEAKHCFTRETPEGALALMCTSCFYTEPLAELSPEDQVKCDTTKPFTMCAECGGFFADCRFYAVTSAYYCSCCIERVVQQYSEFASIVVYTKERHPEEVIGWRYRRDDAKSLIACQNAQTITGYPGSVMETYLRVCDIPHRAGEAPSPAQIAAATLRLQRHAQARGSRF